MVWDEYFNVTTCAAVAITSAAVGFLAGTRLFVVQMTRRNVAGSDMGDENDPFNGDLGECKMYNWEALVVRSDLKMSTGKIAAQCSHAALACYQTLQQTNPVLLRQWERAGQTKVALRCSNEEELLYLQGQAKRLNLCARSIRDAGRTQIVAGSRTVLGIVGPGRLVNQITGTLRLL